MTISQTTVDLSAFTTDAKFRAWSSATAAALLGAGLTQTADTGQINHVTVARPVAPNTSAGYEIWRFNDALQATFPIFLKVEYGSSTNASGQNPGTWLTVGTGSDGVGNITGVGMPRTQTATTSTASTNTTSLVGVSWSAAAGAVTIFAGLNMSVSGPHGGLWSIARTTSSLGAPDGRGVHVSYLTGTSLAAPRSRGAIFGPPTQFAATNPGVGAVAGNASASGGGNIQLYRQHAFLGILYPSVGAIAYFSTDVATNTIITVAPFGATTHNYLAVGAGVVTCYEATQILASIVAAFIWE